MSSRQKLFFWTLPKDGCERIQNVISARKRIRRISIFESELWQVQKRPASTSRRDDQERRRRWRSRVRLVARRLANRSGPAARRSFVRDWNCPNPYLCRTFPSWVLPAHWISPTTL